MVVKNADRRLAEPAQHRRAAKLKFDAVYRQARRAVVAQSITRVQQATGAAALAGAFAIA